MFEVVIDKKIYSHPSRIEEVTLQNWIDLNSEKEDELKAFSAFSGIPHRLLLQCPKSDVLDHLNRSRRLLSNASELTANDPPESFKIGKSTYYVNQSLDNGLMSQYLDCTHYMKFFTNNQAEFFPYMMAIYCLRKGEEYNGEGYDLEKRAKIMRKAQAVDAITINAFFLHGSQDYANNFQVYFQENPPRNN